MVTLCTTGRFTIKQHCILPADRVYNRYNLQQTEIVILQKTNRLIFVTFTGNSSPSTSVFPCQYHSTNAPYPFIQLPPALYNVSLPVLQFSPVSTIPPMLHTHSFTYHPHYIMFLSQYLCFPLSVSFHHCFVQSSSRILKLAVFEVKRKGWCRV